MKQIVRHEFGFVLLLPIGNTAAGNGIFRLVRKKKNSYYFTIQFELFCNPAEFESELLSIIFIYNLPDLLT